MNGLKLLMASYRTNEKDIVSCSKQEIRLNRLYFSIYDDCKVHAHGSGA